eukprot:1321992-Rhodomonas_salina.2
MSLIDLGFDDGPAKAPQNQAAAINAAAALRNYVVKPRLGTSSDPPDPVSTRTSFYAEDIGLVALVWCDQQWVLWCGGTHWVQALMKEERKP